MHLPLECTRKPGRPRLLTRALARQAEEVQKQREPVIVDVSAIAVGVDHKKKSKAKKNIEIASIKGQKRQHSPTLRSSKRLKQ